ncbi:hypothetical protein [Streptomyces sp. NPDC090025]|uniref:hypothetical protein n=1 Tax=Streptomyces sp. NPDC090025 TaxID=3365922 RepID=UPI0038392154
MAAAAAAGVMLSVAGCGSDSGTDKGAADKGGSASAGSTAGSTAGATGGAEAGGELTADAVSKEIETAATAAGFAQDPTGKQIPPGLEKCMVSWMPDTRKAADPKKSYTETVAALTKGGWATGQSVEESGSTIKSLTKSTWTVKASDHTAGVLKLVMFVGTNNTPACAELFKADLEKNKKP